ncbi:major tail protein [Bacillus phage Wes44]|uniref:Major capsid protein n=2 Tax=Carmenvirus TaxID=2842583 RepID=A0A2I7QIP9_9CAUD|nr:major tail protein [Bacillus phage Carmen17]YP_009840459.1 major tail protein [Bacillus phage Wes44]AUR81266.1 major capsid protein [Bacillus phage Carmen17]AXN58354.1 major capsid protein [Bacillus phage Wes44]
MAKGTGFLMNYGYKFAIKNGTTAEMAIGAGVTGVDPDNNEETEDTYYYDGAGSATTDVTGFKMSYAFEGHRKYGDPAQDYIMALANKTGPARKVDDFIVTEPNGDKWNGPATISDIKLPGGDANSKGEIEWTISYDGAPKFTAAV